jgi:hypothetical protein
LTNDLATLIARRLGLSLQAAAADIERLAGPEVEQIYDTILRMLQHGIAAGNAAQPA